MTSPQKEEVLTIQETEYLFEQAFDDEVFLDDSNMEGSSENPSRIRRTSDVIDCVGEVMSPAQIKRHSFPSGSGELLYTDTLKSTNTRDSNRSRRAELTTELIDLGYSSPGAQSLGARSVKETWFSFSTSDTVDSDAIDARPIDQQTSDTSNSSNKITGNKKLIEPTKMPVTQDATSYNMNHEYRGTAVIINHDVFDGLAQSLPDRTGSLKDVEELKTMFVNMDFKVVVWNNLYQDDIMFNLNKLANDDHSESDCLAMVVLSHGINSTFVYAKDNPYPVEVLWSSFTADKCPTLAGKPKLFFIQACRGDRLDGGITLSRESKTEVDSSYASYKIPKHADFLISFSTYEGHYSFRHPENGTWFIQSLCSEISKHDLTTVDFLSIMTRVSRRVALDFESFNDLYPWLHQQKQIPTIHSMLIRDVFFMPKKKPPPEPEIFTT